MMLKCCSEAFVGTSRCRAWPWSRAPRAPWGPCPSAAVLPLAHLRGCSRIEGHARSVCERIRFGAFAVTFPAFHMRRAGLFVVCCCCRAGLVRAPSAPRVCWRVRASLKQANRVPHHYGRVTIAKRLIKVICLQQAYPKLRRAQHTDSTRTAALPVASHSRTPRP